MKFLSYICIIASLATLILAENASWGSTDIVLLRKHILQPQPTGENYYIASVDFPQKGKNNTIIITAILVHDHFTNSSGAIPSLIYGGPDTTFATVTLRSQNGFGIDSTVEIYGRE
uniref:Putative salivary secreted peptide n=1 Tax=Haematobia irritans TaxID=7368 RepID=A0A1L8EIN4_HAEIR